MTQSLLIYANCQGDEIAEMVTRSSVLSGHFKVERIFLGYLDEYMSDLGREEAASRLGRVAAVWQQSSEAGETERDTLRTLVPAAARWSRFPALTCSTLWPFGLSDSRPGGNEMFAYSDTLAARIWRERGGTAGYLEDGADDDLFDRYMELSTRMMPDLERVLERDVVQWRRRDADSDIRMADFLVSKLRQEQLFFTAGRPSWVPTAEILRQLLDALLDDPALKRAAIAEMDYFGACFAGNDSLSVPIHPLIAEGLGLTWYQADQLYRWKGSFWDFREWIIRCVRLSPHCD